MDEQSIRSMLNEALATDPTPRLKMVYTDRDDNLTTRDIYPSQIEERPGRLGFRQPYLVAVDVEKDEPRTFRLDRIDTLEWA